MTRGKVISLAFLVGLLVGLSVPSSNAYMTPVSHTITDSVVSFVNTEECSVTIDHAQYEVDCSSVDFFKQGDSVFLGSEDGHTVIITESGLEVFPVE